MSFPQPSDYRPPIIPDGEVYDNPENGRSYYWTQILLPEGSTPETATSIGGYWTVVCDSANGKYVLKDGDTMTGTLELASEGDDTNYDFDANSTNLTFTTTKTDGSDSKSVSIHQNGYDSSVGITGGVFADGSYYSQSGNYYGVDPSGPNLNTRSPALNLNKNNGLLKWDSLILLRWTEHYVEIPKPTPSQDGKGFKVRGASAAGYETDARDEDDAEIFLTYHDSVGADYINYKGKINDPTNLVNKGYVDAKDDLLRQDIIELEEEIDAIAPSVEYGSWEWEQPVNNTRAPKKGTFYLLDSSNQLTDKYQRTKVIVINNYEYKDPTDDDPVDIHTWADADVGELIQLYDAADPDFLLGKIESKATDTETNADGTLEFVRITVQLIQTSGVPNDNKDPVTDKYLTRINVFKEPSGGDAGEFVRKAGDTMTGRLQLNKPFKNSSSGVGFTVYGATTNHYANNVKDENGKLIEVYHNGNAVDAVNYNGKIDSLKNIVNVEYLRENAVRIDPKDVGLEIYKSGSSYYISGGRSA